MHGRRKVKTTEDKMREKKEADRQRAAKYSKLVAAAFELKSAGEKSEKALKVAGEVLSVNADCYTFWNYRREIIQQLMKEKSEEEMTALLKGEVAWLEQTLAQWPKSYWVWFHRKWLSQYLTMDWARELELCLKLHKMDSRNFHCWNYRRFAVEQAKVSPEAELSMAIGLIEENFSNYSAWHHRSIFLPKAFGDQVEELRNQIQEEFEKVKAAFYTEPEDQSAWFYHRWLVGIMKQKAPDSLEAILRDQLQTCEELLTIEENCKWALLTIVFLKLELKEAGVAEDLQRLKDLDSKRSGFYGDLAKSIVC
jgi:geranylgeranyl transferase type-2 subunit alpha